MSPAAAIPAIAGASLGRLTDHHIIGSESARVDEDSNLQRQQHQQALRSVGHVAQKDEA
jgi:hypothetical protein